MKEYFLGLFIASIICTVITLLAAGSGGEKYVKYLCALVCIIMVVSPIAGMKFDDFSFELPETSAIDTMTGITTVTDMTEDNLLLYINEILLAEYGITAAGVSINIDSGDNSVTITEVNVFIKNEDSDYLDEVSSSLRTLLGSGITVSILG